ncbi:MAG: sulfatase family protein [Pirellulaceae bacterium]
MKYVAFVCFLLLFVCSTAVSAQVRERVSTPNVVVILADDLGYGDVSCNNAERGKIHTPCIDRLAAQGLRFTDAHSSSGVCSPSRYTLLTGRYHWRSRLQQGIVNVWEPPLIAPDRLTIAGLAGQHGYRTACIGKWHLGWDWPIATEQRAHFQEFGSHTSGDQDQSEADLHRAAWSDVFSQPIGGGPTTRGFDIYFGTDVPNWPPYCFIDNDRTVGIPSELLPAKLLTSNLASLPGPALRDWELNRILPTLADRACAFILESARNPAPFLLYLPLTSPHTPLAVNDPWKGRSGLESLVADLVMETDAVVGRVLDALEESGVAENTLVIFTSDNGFAPYTGAEHLEARGHYPSGPLRGYKADAWEGGHRVPFLARWPGVVTPERVSNQLVHQADLLATLAEILGTTLPDNAGEDSVSLLPLFRGEDKPLRTHAISQGSDGLLVLRDGSWKLIVGPGGGGAWSSLSAEPKATTPGQLYDLDADLGEQQNVYAEHPERVAAMLGLLEKLVTEGRSTPGVQQKNDVTVRWRRFMDQAAQPDQENRSGLP